MIFTLHLKQAPQSEGRFDSLVAIPEGLAKWALIVPPFWLARHKLWFAFALYSMVALAGFALLPTSFGIIPAMMGGLPGLYLLLEGHQLRRNKLENEGYETVAILDASSEQMAIEHFLSAHEEKISLDTHQVDQRTAFVRPRSIPTQPGIGLFTDSGR